MSMKLWKMSGDEIRETLEAWAFTAFIGACALMFCALGLLGLVAVFTASPENAPPPALTCGISTTTHQPDCVVVPVAAEVEKK